MWWFGIGAVLGSVANAVIYRLPRGIGWWQGSSACPHCKHSLAWYDLIPLLSFVSLGGKCRYCHKFIGWRYFLVELVMAVGFAYLQSPLPTATLFITVIIAAMDWETQLVSDWLIAAWAVLAVIQLPNWSVSQLMGIAVGAGLIGGIWAISRGKAMGFGDVEIAAVMGLWLGWPKTVHALWLAFVLGAGVGIWYLAVGKKKLKSRIAFGPFLLIGAWVANIVNLSHVFPF